MATRLNDHEPLRQVPHVRWSDFADGAVWELKRGVDFQQKAEKARRAFVLWAIRHGLKGHSSVVDPDTIKVQIERVEPEPDPVTEQLR